jgi:hypothetical protein
MSVRVHIENLSIEGAEFGKLDADVVRDFVQTRLAATLGQRGRLSAIPRSRDTEVAQGVPLQLPHGSSPEFLGHGIADSLGVALGMDENGSRPT